MQFDAALTQYDSRALLGTKLQIFHDLIVSQFPEETRAQRKPSQM